MSLSLAESPIPGNQAPGLAVGVLVADDVQCRPFALLDHQLVELFTAPFFLGGDLSRSDNHVTPRFGLDGFDFAGVQFEHEALKRGRGLCQPGSDLVAPLFHWDDAPV